MFKILLTLVLTQASAPVRLDNPATAGVSSTRSISTGTSTSTGLSGGGDLSADRSLACVAASGSSAGCLTTGTQTIAGDKTISGNIAATNLSGTNTGDVTIGTANGLSLTGQALSLGAAVAGGANGALLGTDKTKLDATTNTNSGDVTLGAVGSSPSANGASLSGQVLTLQPEDSTHPGVVSNGAQTISGAKTFSSTVTSSVTSTNTAFSMVQGALLNFGGRTLQDNGANLALSSGVLVGGGISNSSSTVPVGVGCSETNATSRHCVQLFSTNTLSSSGDLIISAENPQNTTKWGLYYDGSTQPALITLQTCAAALEGLLSMDAASGVSTAHRTRYCMCTSNGAGTPVYAWQNIVSGTVGTTTTCSD